MTDKKYSIAIDGPSGAGKSTIAKAVARKLGFIYVDTGAIYRAVGYYARSRGIVREEIEKVIPELKNVDLELEYTPDGTQQVILNGENVTDKIRQPEISLYASDVSKLAAVRDFLLEMQRRMAREYNVIMDGRDIGTVVLPDADVKIFLTATAEDRARRRYDELKKRGTEENFQAVLRDMEYRDKQDSERDVAPLKAAPDAVTIDTTGNSFEKSLRVVTDAVRERLGR